MIKFITKTVLMASLLAAGLTACTSKSNSPATGVPSITVSGAISSASALAVDSSVGKMALTLTNLEIYVIYTSGTTVGIAQAAVGADGAWSFSVPAGSQINAIVRDKTSLELVGPIVFVDSSSTDIDGNPKTSTVTALKSGASLGTITLSSTGKFEVPVAQIAASQDTAVAAPTTTLDFSGEWTIAKYDGTMPDSSYRTALAIGDANCPDAQHCNGTQVGEKVYFLKLSGKKFTYPATGNCATYKANHTGTCNPDTTDGTTDSTTTVDAASIWGGASAIAGCGYKLGFSRADAAAGGGINLLDAELPTVNTTQMTFGGVVWSTFPNGWGVTLSNVTYPWAATTATTNYPMMNCTQVDKTVSSTTYSINVCKGKLHSDGTTVKYQANYGGGCLNASGKPVVIKDWSALGTPASCNGPTSFAVTGMSSNSCSYTGVADTVASDTAFTCTYVGGVFDNADVTGPTSLTNGDYVVMDQITAGTTCSAINSGDLDKLKCYANYYFQNQPNLSCGKDYRFNWNATTAADFVQVDHRDKPKSNYLTNLVTYSSDGNTFFLEDHQDDGVQISTGSGSTAGSTFCRIERTTLLKGSKVTDTKMLIELNQSVALLDTTNAACVASKNDSTANNGNGSELYNRTVRESANQLFYMTK